MKSSKVIISFMFALLALPVEQVKAQSFLNPILSGFYPDPSICKAGEDYYLVNSSFAYYPGLPIFHSKDLVNWELIGHVLDRPEQLNLDGAGVSRGLFAPSISYHNGLFYVVCTLIDKGGNFVVTATDPKGPWSNPVWIPEVNGIDPSLFFEGNGKAYIVYNSVPPENKALYSGHRTIRINEFDAVRLKVIGKDKVIVNGGSDINKKPIWIEGPHIFQKDGWYYLICAEGGTGYNHSEVVFRTKHLDSAFVPFDKNPILTQRHLSKQRKYPITTTGHAQLIEDKGGNWWAVFLGCRPYQDDHYNTGRETFMAPVEWKNGWPIIDPEHEEVQYSYSIKASINNKAEKFNGNFLFKDGFNNKQLNNRYSFLRTPRSNWCNISDGKLDIQLRPETCSGNMSPSFIGFRQAHLKGEASTYMDFVPKDSNEKAGLLVFQNEQHYYFICESIQSGRNTVQLYKADTLLASIPVPNIKGLYLKIEANNNVYSFFYAVKKNDWLPLRLNEDATFLSTQSAGGFVGCMYAMYASSNGKPSVSHASYDWFACQSKDDVYLDDRKFSNNGKQ